MTALSDSFKLWFDYDLRANERVLATIENNIGHLPDDALKLFSHIIAAHHIWNSRIAKETSKYKVWERIPVSEMAEALQLNYKTTLAMLESIDNGGDIEYVNTIGDRYFNNVSDILFHVLTHNHYHRGQIARNLRENNIDPPDTNYIVFRR